MVFHTLNRKTEAAKNNPLFLGGLSGGIICFMRQWQQLASFSFTIATAFTIGGSKIGEATVIVEATAIVKQQEGNSKTVEAAATVEQQEGNGDCGGSKRAAAIVKAAATVKQQEGSGDCEGSGNCEGSSDCRAARGQQRL